MLVHLSTVNLDWVKWKKMNEVKNEISIKFQSKAEIAECIKALTPFAVVPSANSWAMDKIKDLTKLL